jgi:acyl-CoA hydrolase
LAASLPDNLPIPAAERIMSSITLRFLAEPGTVNFGGRVHGYKVMKWIDEAGHAWATRCSENGIDAARAMQTPG